MTTYYKDWRDAGQDVERLGLKLDQARERLAKTKPDTWAHTFWTGVEAKLLKKWKMTLLLKDVGLIQGSPTAGDDIKRDYGWLEKPTEIRDAINIKFIDPAPDLTRSWETAREEFIQKARRGMA